MILFALARVDLAYPPSESCHPIESLATIRLEFSQQWFVGMEEYQEIRSNRSIRRER